MKPRNAPTMVPDISAVKKESDSVSAVEMYIDVPEEGVMQVRHHRDSDDVSIRDDMEIEEPPSDDVKVTADHGVVWYEGKMKGLYSVSC